MKIVLFGKSGQVGWELQRALAPMGEVISFGRGPDYPNADITNPEELANAIRVAKPDVTVNAAAYTSVDTAEERPAVRRPAPAHFIGPCPCLETEIVVTGRSNQRT